MYPICALGGAVPMWGHMVAALAVSGELWGISLGALGALARRAFSRAEEWARAAARAAALLFAHYLFFLCGMGQGSRAQRPCPSRMVRLLTQGGPKAAGRAAALPFAH